MLILSRPRNIASGLSTNRACMVGAMTEDNIPDTDQKKSYHCTYFPGILKTYQHQHKLFEFLWDTNREELKMRKKWRHFTMVSLYNGTTSLCNYYVAFKKTVCKYF